MLNNRLKSGPIWALGTMSGTSLDGVDAAMVLTDGANIFGFGKSAYRPYSDDERKILNAALGRWDRLDAATALVETAHVDCLSEMTGMNVIGFHGQTVAHDPGGRGTRQIGDGRKLAHVLDCPVVWDFRRADMEMGGQGAPLAPFFHHACAKWIRARTPLAFLNLGGVGNITWIDPRIGNPAEYGACLAFDTGPANAPLNDFMATRSCLPMDRNGELASTGVPDPLILDQLSRQDWFAKPPPKSLDRNDFDWLFGAVAHLGDADAAATLTAVIASSVALGMKQCPSTPERILVTGGGRLNPLLMAMLAAECDCPVDPVESVGLDGDMLEAQAFAYLAVRVLQGWPTSAPFTTGAAAPVCGGILSMPEDAARGAEARA